ncbi:MAG: NAD(P)-dependent oxidoreductase [Proteobacteria bacterium]|nr:NAD(P)-dependent oxidoreductase [Pseudomonadota bacterium]
MKVAVTGASGFIGLHVLRELAARGAETVATAFRHPPIGGFTHVCDVHLDIHTLTDDPFTLLGRPDVLLHFAWSGLPHYDSSHHVTQELPAQKAFLSNCVRSGIRRIVVAGTCFEYGLAHGEIQESQPLQPVTRYGEAKASLFEHMSSLRESLHYELAWPRIFYLFGPGQSPNSLYSQLHAAIVRGDRHFDMSGGDQVRDYLPVGEAARLLVEIAFHAGNTGSVNLCSGVPVRIRDLVASWIDAAGAGLQMNLGRFPYPTYEPMSFWGSRRKLEQILGGA